MASEPHETETLIRYAEIALTAEERSAAERHLSHCEACREYLTFVGDFNDALRSANPADTRANEPHPDSSLIIALAEEELDEPTAENVRDHLLFCDECADEFSLLEGIAQEEAASAPWRKFIEQLRRTMVDLWKSYGVGAVLGPFTLLAETPALTVRGGEKTAGTFKVLEVSVGGNLYSLELSSPGDGSLSCDMAGVNTQSREPLTIMVRSESGKPIASAKSDDFGNARLAIPTQHPSMDLYVLSLELKAVEQHLLISVPKH